MNSSWLLRAGHTWLNYDLDGSFIAWLASQDYAEEYFEDPELLAMIMHKYLDFIADDFSNFLALRNAGPETVAAITSVGSLLGMIKIRDVVERMAPTVQGRLLIFFPGSYENNNYRLLDMSEGAIAIVINVEKSDRVRIISARLATKDEEKLYYGGGN